MAQESMRNLRARRVQRGLVQVNVWIKADDRTAFDMAIAPFKTRAIEADTIDAASSSMTPAPATPIENNDQPAAKSRRASQPRAPKLPGIMLPCRVVFQTKPATAIRNRMKDEGWVYDDDVWWAYEIELVTDWRDQILSLGGEFL
jgi:hypothetical protein